MSRSELVQYSYLRSIREVEPSPSLEEFLVRGLVVSKRIFGLKDKGWMVKLPATREEELSPGRMAQYEGVGLPDVTIFPAKSLRVTLLERRALTTHEANDLILRAYNRIDSSYVSGGRMKRTVTGRKYPSKRPNPLPEELRLIEEEAGIHNGKLTVVAEKVVDSTKSDYAHLGTEYSLAINPETIGARVLRAQAALLKAALRRTVVGRPLFKGDFEQDSDELNVQFMQVPGGSPDDHALFLETMNDGTHVEMTVRQPKWVPGRPQPEVLDAE